MPLLMVLSHDGRKLILNASTLSLGMGRVKKCLADTIIFSDIPHEYAKTIGYKSSRFFDGKILVGHNNGRARIESAKSGSPMKISVESGSSLKEGELFDYIDLSPGNRVRIPLLQLWNANDPNELTNAR